MKKKVKTTTKTQHKAHLTKQKDVLKRTKSKALSKVISCAREGKGKFKAHN
jgi:hypothetical protein